MRIGDVKRYFKTLINSRRKAKCKSADYCWRCGRFLARDRIFEKGQNYMGFNLCPECYEYKTSSKTESVPDIEDIKRFGLSFNF
ncbi:hypothetical protein ISS03_04220 [Patescibacteria group bacterium]|nr:hypothetical protein [Patescibacteria group bacterium]